jgi:membrane protein
MPPGVWDLLRSQLQDVASHQHGALTASAIIGLLIALWSASSWMSALMTATNVAYGEREQRGFLLRSALALLLTVGSLIAFVILLALAFAVPIVLGLLGTRPWLQFVAELVRWLLLWCFAVGGIAIIYRLAPSRESTRWHWLSAGSIIAATLWLAGTILFALYERLFASYQKTYGALGGVVVLLMWFYLSSFLLVLGAQINAEVERQIDQDTTPGPRAAESEPR